MEVRHPTHPQDATNYSPERLRAEYQLEGLMKTDKITLVYTHHDRMIAGGAVPAGKELTLDTYEALKSEYFLERRELGIINVGGDGTVKAGDDEFALAKGECLYVGRGTEDVVFKSDDSGSPAHFYLISTPAHAEYPTRKGTKDEATIENLGSGEACNERSIFKFIHPDGIESCQLVMGYTELKSGSVWNTMPAHTHDRRSEIYFYFDLPEEQRIFHFMGQPDDTRHLVLANEQGAISPSWSIHAGSGTGPYSFIWAMGGENQSFADMDFVSLDELK